MEIRGKGRVLLPQKNGCKAWFSQLNSKRAGVGLIVKDKFLSKFKKKPPVWEEVIKGRAGVLHLEGEEGRLDIWTSYFPTGVPENSATEGKRRNKTKKKRNMTRVVKRRKKG